MAIDLEEQYDKIYRYCYFRLRSRELAEDITQEAFLRCLEHYPGLTSGEGLRCLYTIARNLCADEYRRPKTEPLEKAVQGRSEEAQWLANLGVRAALSRLTSDEQELLLLRYVNEVPVGTIGRLLGISRFVVYRRLTAASNKFREELKKEDFHG